MATRKYLVPLEFGEELVEETLHKLKHHEEDILEISGNSMESVSHMVEIQVMSPGSNLQPTPMGFSELKNISNLGGKMLKFDLAREPILNF